MESFSIVEIEFEYVFVLLVVVVALVYFSYFVTTHKKNKKAYTIAVLDFS